MNSKGRAYQRHDRECPRTEDGTGYRTHKCRKPWAYMVDAGRFEIGDNAGKRRQLSKSGFPTKTAASAALAQVLERLRNGDPSAENLTVGVYLRQWLDGKARLRPTTRRSYEDHLRLYLIPRLGRLRLVDLRGAHIDKMYASIREGNSERERPVGEASIRRLHATLSSALNSAVKRRLVPWAVTAHVELSEVTRHEPAIWSGEQIGTFLTSNRDHRLVALFHVIALRGLRRGEACGLRWSDVGLDAGRLRVAQQVVQVGYGTHVGLPKTKRGERTVSLDAGTVDVLRRHRVRHAQERLAIGEAWADTDGRVFVREDGAPLHPEFVTRLFERLTRRAGLPSIRLHDLRHSAASLALAAGIHPKIVSEQLGHSTIAVTLDTYSHVLPAVAHEAAEKVASLVVLAPFADPIVSAM